MSNKLTRCVGCYQHLSRLEPRLTCHFANTQWTLDNKRYLACYSSYHPPCIRAGLPFTTRHSDSYGLSFPKNCVLPIFVCEMCTVRAHIGEEITFNPRHTALVMLERMRLIDTVHNWAKSTLGIYKQKVDCLVHFQQSFGVVIIPTCTSLLHPPVTQCIPAIWAQLQYSIQPGRKNGTMSFTTVRNLRSAISALHSWLLLTTDPDHVILDGNKIPWSNSNGRVTDSYIYTA